MDNSIFKNFLLHFFKYFFLRFLLFFSFPDLFPQTFPSPFLSFHFFPSSPFSSFIQFQKSRMKFDRNPIHDCTSASGNHNEFLRIQLLDGQKREVKTVLGFFFQFLFHFFFHSQMVLMINEHFITVIVSSPQRIIFPFYSFYLTSFFVNYCFCTRLFDFI